MRILVLHEKHGDSYYDATTEAALHAAALKIVRQRLKQGYYQAGKPPEDPGLTRKEALKLPVAVQRSALDVLATYERRMRIHNDIVRIQRWAQDAVEKRDGVLAFQTLEACREGEYENFSLADVDQPLSDGRRRSR